MLVAEPHLARLYVLFPDLAQRASGESPAERSQEVTILHDGDRGVRRPLEMAGARCHQVYRDRGRSGLRITLFSLRRGGRSSSGHRCRLSDRRGQPGTANKDAHQAADDRPDRQAYQQISPSSLIRARISFWHLQFSPLQIEFTGLDDEVAKCLVQLLTSSRGAARLRYHCTPPSTATQ